MILLAEKYARRLAQKHRETLATQAKIGSNAAHGKN
jgi:hypothetical protein